MKKLTALLLALAMMLALVACGGNTNNTANSGNGGNTSANDQQEATDGDDVAGEAEGVGINFSEKTLTAFGESFRLALTGDVAADAKISFSTSDDGVAVVSQDGTVTAAGVGKATITVTDETGGEKNELTCTVTCTWEENVPTLSRTDFTLKNVGDSFKLEAMNILDGSEITWASADETVATVAEDGTVTAVGAGHTTITATVDEGGETYDLTCIVRCSAAAAAGEADLTFFHEGGAAMGLGLVEDAELIENFYTGLGTVETETSLLYMSMMGISNSELALVKVKDAADVNMVKGIFQNRVDYMVEGGAFYPATIEIWTNQAQIVSGGNYVLLAVGETAADIVASFNAAVK